MDFDPDNPQLWFTWAVLSEALEGFSPDDDDISWAEVRYIAQDPNGKWFGYGVRPKYTTISHEWSIWKNGSPDSNLVRCIGSAPLHRHNVATRYYEVNHDL